MALQAFIPICGWLMVISCECQTLAMMGNCHTPDVLHYQDVEADCLESFALRGYRLVLVFFKLILSDLENYFALFCLSVERMPS